MQAATNSEDNEVSSEMEEDDDETDKDQEEDVPVQRIRSKMKLRSTLSVSLPSRTSPRQGISGKKRKDFMETIRLKKEQEEQSKQKKKKSYNVNSVQKLSSITPHSRNTNAHIPWRSPSSVGCVQRDLARLVAATFMRHRSV